ncbi:MAG: leucine--tRNA ligase [Planctomycetota bacterium]
MKYDFNVVEQRWREYWAKTGLFNTSPNPTAKFYMLEMFAYPSGDIHIGHFRNYTIGDAYTRYKKMCGCDVMHPFGWDAFGLPAEEAAIKNKLHPRDWTLNNISTSRETLKTLSISYDWNREVITCLPDYYKWTQWIFTVLHKRGLAYQADSLVNWCPSCKTVLANEQVENDGSCWRCHSIVTKRNLKQWFFRITDYAERLLRDTDKLAQWPENIKTMQRNWIGRSEGTEIIFPIPDSEYKLPVFTTRIDTIFGVTFVSIAPEHPWAMKITNPQNKSSVEEYIKKATNKTDWERSAEGEKDGVFTGTYALNPLSGEKIPIWVADYVLPHYGTGVVMAVPAHDQRDFDFAKKYNLPVKTVINPKNGNLAEPLVRLLEQSELQPTIGGSNSLRSNCQPIKEAYADLGVMANSGQFNGLTSEQGIAKVTEFLVQKKWGNKKINYRLRDWLISRQRYWGAPIPMVHCGKCGAVPVPEKDLPVLLPDDVKDFIPKGRSPLADVPAFINTNCPKCGGPAQRDPDTMDTFVCSSWYHLRYADPRNDAQPFTKEAVNKWLPIDLYVGGAEHACGHLIYFRFITKVLFDEGWLKFDEPAVRLFNHGMVLDGKGEVMSKSKGNVVSPADLIRKDGVDVARIAMFFAAPSEAEILWNDSGIVGARRFVSRLSELVQAVSDIKKDESLGDTKRLASLSEMDKLYQKLNQTIKRVAEDIEALHYNTAISAVMELVNHMYEVKNLLRHPTRATDYSALETLLAKTTRTVILLVAPFIPHLAEQLWESIGERPSIFNQKFPKYNPDALKTKEVELVIQINGKVRSRITVPAEMPEAALKNMALADEKITQILKGSQPLKVIIVPGKLVNIVV